MWWDKLVSAVYNKNVKSKWRQVAGKINDLQRSYMQAQMAVMKAKLFILDANSTLGGGLWKRGLLSTDGKYYYPFTYLDGVMENMYPEIWNWRTSKKLREFLQGKRLRTIQC